MQNFEAEILSDGTKLCLECGLCCTGVFQTNAAIYSTEDKKCAEAFDATIFSKDGKEYFKLPCPIYDGKCPIYPDNPSVCRSHKCNLLKDIENCKIELERAITIVQEMKQVIDEIEHDIKLPSLKINTGDIDMNFLFSQFFDSTTEEERKNFGNLLKNYGAFDYLKKKYFYK